MKEVLNFASQTKTSLTRIMLDNMVIPLPNGDVDISMLKEAVQLVNGRFETEVYYLLFHLISFHVIQNFRYFVDLMLKSIWPDLFLSFVCPYIVCANLCKIYACICSVVSCVSSLEV